MGSCPPSPASRRRHGGTATSATSSTAQKADTGSVTETFALGAGASAGSYDLTVIGPNRFLRRFTGDALSGDTTSAVQAGYYPDGFTAKPKLVLELINAGTDPVTFTVTPDNYSTDAVNVYQVPAQGRAKHVVDALRTSAGWYDVSVTVSSDASWLRRYVGHLETGSNSVTG